ncbi:hypothetical protein PMAYCL1PPCAC_06206 [Pristionchus mayeri]|uniref:Uncharacterized protein n=1 Tax=Pristionchus mayeri TaxID=1317129 RepID=A0AAN4ZBH1_9BILA|nr:hypothetical protein PMAYCL1PPCAC_06206 [Pristionchus mayeri]
MLRLPHHVILCSICFKTVSAKGKASPEFIGAFILAAVIIFFIRITYYWCKKMEDVERQILQSAMNQSCECARNTDRNVTDVEADYPRSPRPQQQLQPVQPPYPLEQHPLLPQNGPGAIGWGMGMGSLEELPSAPPVQPDIPLTPPPRAILISIEIRLISCFKVITTLNILQYEDICGRGPSTTE